MAGGKPHRAPDEHSHRDSVLIARSTLFCVLLCALSALAASALQEPFRIFGPQLQWGALASSGLNPRGAWMPQGNIRFHFDWLEPLDETPYHTPLLASDRFLRFSGNAELSPLYGLFGVAIGAAPLPLRALQVEFRLSYTNLIYFDSNVEMPLSDGSGKIQNTWNAGYIFDHLHDRSSFGQIQNFAFRVEISSQLSWMRFWAFGQFSLVDVKSSFFGSQFSGKSFDYKHNIPVFSRDHLWQAGWNGTFLMSPFLDWNLAVDFYRTGKTIHTDNPKFFDKEPLGYVKLLTGPEFTWQSDKVRHKLLLRPGVWVRFKGNGDFGDSLTDRIIMELRYLQSWHL
jgi:hypothetical protein